MVSKKKKLKSGNKESRHIALKLSLLTAIVLPTLFVLLRRESLQEKEEPIAVAGLGMLNNDASLETDFAISSVELAVIEFETPIAFVQ